MGPLRGPASDDESDTQMELESEVDQINESGDMDDDADAQGELGPDTEEPDADGAAEDEDGDEDVDVEEEDDLQDDASELGAASSPARTSKTEAMPAAARPRLKITLKLPTQHAGPSKSTRRIVSTPDEVPVSRTRRAREPVREVDIESEDEDEEDDGDDEDALDEEDDEDVTSTRSTSVATAGASSRALTARQAVLANVVDSSHVSLGQTANSRKKKPLTEDEIALKREETARKRRNLTEKKLEDEKTETINRLLKKQSRGKGRRNALSTADDRPTLGAAAADVDAEVGEAVVAPEPVVPTMYRWVSTSRPTAGTENADASENAEATTEEERKMTIAFAVPVAALPAVTEPVSEKMDTDAVSVVPERKGGQPAPQCDVEGCSERRKYRLVKDWGKGACGMGHLKMLEAQLA